MFNWFTKRKKQPDRLAAITYYIEGDNTVKLDIELNDYEDRSVNAISEVFKVLSQENFFIETLEFYKNAMQKEERDDIVLKTFVNLGDIVQEYVARTHENLQKKQETPYIKPSDLQR